MKLRPLALTALAAVALAGCATTPPTTVPSTNQSSDSTVQSNQPTKSDITTCTYRAAGQSAKPVDPPQSDNVPTTGTLTFTMKMTAGDVTVTLDRAGAPCAVNSFASLVSQGYYDDTDCHRLVPGFVLQCGDPSATGRGGPGYSYNDELTGKETYPRGTVAMANAGPNTNGSQFFIVLADAGLQPNYDVIGTVDAAGMAVVDQIASAGVDPNDPATIKPMFGAHINSVTAG
ncbi:MAG: peptidylprolyl isomerase [Propionibacteriaceae bacterium]|nr:peptidylprolyl isomerase [Propionibacteriaceae bacterium]